MTFIKQLKADLFPHMKSFRYFEGHKDYWRDRPFIVDFSSGSIGSLLMRYTIGGTIRRVDNEAFFEAKMLSSANVNMIIIDFRDAFLQWMNDTNRHFHISELDGDGRVIRITPDGIEDDAKTNAITKVDFGNQYKFSKNGCEIWLTKLNVYLDTGDERNIWGNYNMVAATRKISVEEELAAYRAKELAILVYMTTRLTLLRQTQATKEYKIKGVTITTEILSEKTARLFWKFAEKDNAENLRLQVFRRRGGFANTEDSSGQGDLVVDSRVGDTLSVALNGEPQFYTCYVLSAGARHDFLRFELSVPASALDAQLVKTLTEMVDQLENGKAPAADPRREKINSAFEELRSFVEFDDNLTELEKTFIAQIQTKNYTAEEREEKIERLKLAVEDLRLKHS